MLAMTQVLSESATQQIIQRHDAFMSLNYPRYPVALVRGLGCEVWDAEGKRYLDLFAGFGAPVLGHCHPDLVAAVTEQASRLWHVGNLFHTEPQTHAAEAIARHGFGGRTFFSHSGADANEAAIKLARLYGKVHRGNCSSEYGRYRLISATRSFHGRSFATMGATGNAAVRTGFEPLLPGYVNVAYNDLDAIKAEIDADTVAVIVEPVQGEGGINMPDADYFPRLRAFCDEHDLLLICDEVWTGCGRTGRYFGYQLWGVEPDIMTLGKGVGGGLAVGAMCAKPHVAELYDAKKQGAVKHASTLGGNCIAMAVTAAIFHVLERDGLVERAAELGEALMLRLQSLRLPGVTSVRGRGLFIGIELDEAKRKAGDVVKACLDRGLIIGSAQQNTLRIAPALVVEQHHLDEGLGILEDAISA
jgi:acetylornithine/N-succinyldiaminopimelate aminotransferase